MKYWLVTVWHKWRKLDPEPRSLTVYLLILGVVFFFTIDKLVGIGIGVVYLFVLGIIFIESREKAT